LLSIAAALSDDITRDWRESTAALQRRRQCDPADARTTDSSAGEIAEEARIQIQNLIDLTAVIAVVLVIALAYKD
jgi:hypothetical protein